MGRARLLGRARRAAKRQYVDQCKVEYKVQGASVQNETNGKKEPVYATRFTSKCKLQTRGTFGTPTVTRKEVGGRDSVRARYEVHLPASSPLPQKGDRVTITAVGRRSDPHLVGRVYRILSPSAKTSASAHRFDIEEIL